MLNTEQLELILTTYNRKEHLKKIRFFARKEYN
jgi:hypothetical protein